MKVIENGASIPTSMKKQHVENFKKVIRREDKIVESERMKVERHTIHTMSEVGESEEDVRSRLVNEFHTCVKF
jgi:hypothetical protein